MTMKILASSASMDSAMKLRDALEVEMGLKPKTILVTSKSGACEGYDVLLRYGCGYGKLKKEPVWGNPGFVNLCIDKQATSAMLKGVVPFPEFITDKFPTKFPVLIRETLTGAQSEGIHVCHNQPEFLKFWKEGFVWTYYFEHDIEVRANVVFLEDRIETRIYRKVPMGEYTGAAEFVPGIGGADNANWLLKSPTDYPKVLATLEKMKPAMLKAGARFVGIDMIYATDLKEYVVLEMNSGPWLTLKSADWLAAIFLKEYKPEPVIKFPVKCGEYDEELGGYGIYDQNNDTVLHIEGHVIDFDAKKVADLVVKALNSYKE